MYEQRTSTARLRSAWFLSALAALACRSTPAPADSSPLDPARTHALIVGVLEWQHGLTPYPKKDRKDVELRDLLVQRGTPESNVTLLLDQEATLPKIRAALAETARSCEPGSTLIVYYAGHGMPSGANDTCFANYELDPKRPAATGWSLRELGETLAREFEGERVLLHADCCYSGGLESVVVRLEQAGIAAANLTSAGPANTSTDNWTFTQSLIDGLRGEPLLDTDGDGRVTLGELEVEVQDAMDRLEGQAHGYATRGVGDALVLAQVAGARARAPDAKFAIGSYVVAPDGDRRRPGRVVDVAGERYAVRFYDYSDKRICMLDALDLEPWTRASVAASIDANAEPAADCEVEWNGSWWAARILREEGERHLVRYQGYSKDWDEWVGPDRIRTLDANAATSEK
jgi:hypothetical protein